MKPDHNNEPLWLTSLRHNKQCFDMVLNIPFPPTHTHSNKHCTPLCQAQQASCDGALLASYLPDANNRANKGCRRRVTIGQVAEVTLVQAENEKIKAFNISQVLTCCFGVVMPTVCYVTRAPSFLYSRQWYVWTAKGQPIWCMHSWCRGSPRVWIRCACFAEVKTAKQVTTVHYTPDWLPRLNERIPTCWIWSWHQPFMRTHYVTLPAMTKKPQCCSDYCRHSLAVLITVFSDAFF